MDLQILDKITELAQQPEFTPGDVARVLGLDVADMRDGAYLDAFDRGKLMLKLAHNKKVNQLSQQGSGPAQSLVTKMMRQAEIDSMREYYG